MLVITCITLSTTYWRERSRCITWCDRIGLSNFHWALMHDSVHSRMFWGEVPSSTVCLGQRQGVRLVKDHVIVISSQSTKDDFSFTTVIILNLLNDCIVWPFHIWKEFSLEMTFRYLIILKRLLMLWELVIMELLQLSQLSERVTLGRIFLLWEHCTAWMHLCCHIIIWHMVHLLCLHAQLPHNFCTLFRFIPCYYGLWTFPKYLVVPQILRTVQLLQPVEASHYRSFIDNQFWLVPLIARVEWLFNFQSKVVIDPTICIIQLFELAFPKNILRRNSKRCSRLLWCDIISLELSCWCQSLLQFDNVFSNFRTSHLVPIGNHLYFSWGAASRVVRSAFSKLAWMCQCTSSVIINRHLL